MRGEVKAWVAYAAAGTVAVVLITVVAVLMVGGANGRAVMTGAAIAYGLQLAAFAMLLAVRDKSHLFLAGWLGGIAEYGFHFDAACHEHHAARFGRHHLPRVEMDLGKLHFRAKDFVEILR